MGRAILCIGDTAKTPYMLKKLGISIYTVEELCYCIRENTVLMDEELVCQTLVDWLREECGLAELADSLKGFLRTKGSASAFLTTILEYTGYYPKEEIQQTEQFLKTGAGLSGTERQKSAADYLAGSGKYGQALKRYYELLRELPQEDALLRGKVFHNMGCVCGRMFLFEKSAQFFRQAYELSGEWESLLQFLAAKRLLLPEKEYIDFVVNLPQEEQNLSMELEKRVEAAANEWKECVQARELFALCMQRGEQEEEYGSMLEDMAERMKERYRGMV